MTTYFHFARFAFADHLSGRIRIFSRFLVCLLLVWTMVSMWRLIYASGHGPDGVSLIDIGWYNGIAQMMFFLSPRLFVVIDDDVRSGNIGYFLNRPIPYLWMRLAEGVGALTANILIYFPLLPIILYFSLGGLPSGGIPVVVSALVLLAGGSLLHLMFQVVCGLSTFWTNDAIFIYHAYQKILILLGGIYIPLSFYPAAMMPDFLTLLPPAAMVGGPASLAIGTESFGAVLLAQLFWIVVVYLGLKAFYGVCLRKVEVNGG